jgi:carbamoyl-phosphate synthase large subunit
MSDKKKICIAVTGLNAIDSPGPGVAVIRALKESTLYDVHIIGLSYDALEPGIYMDNVCNKTYQLPYPSAGSEILLERLTYIHEIENLELIIPNFDAELPNFMKISEKLKRMGIATFLPTFEQLEARDKINLYQFGKKHDFWVPRDKVIYSITELRGIAQEFGFPLVVKGKYYEATIAHTLEQAEKGFQKLQSKWGLPIIVQEFIHGTEINVAALGDGNGTCISAIPMRKLYITDKGKAWAGITLEDASLIQLAQKFVASTKWKGGFELEIMRTIEGRPYIMEINPRFPAWIYLTAGAGQNQPEALLQMAMGAKLEPFESYQVGKLFIRYSWDLIADVSDFQHISAFGETAPLNKNNILNNSQNQENFTL